MFNESILELTPLSFYIMQCKTDVTCIFPNFCFLIQSLHYVKTAKLIWKFVHSQILGNKEITMMSYFQAFNQSTIGFKSHQI